MLLPPEEYNWQVLSKRLFWVWRGSIVMLIVLSLGCSAAVVFSWKKWAEGFPRTYLWGRAGCHFIWFNAGSCKPAFPPILCTYFPASCNGALWAFTTSSRESIQGHKLTETSPARVGHFWSEQLLSCGLPGLSWSGSWDHDQCRKASKQQQYWPGLAQSTHLWGYLWHLGAFLPFPSPSILIITGEVLPWPVRSCPFLEHQLCC